VQQAAIQIRKIQEDVHKSSETLKLQFSWNHIRQKTYVTCNFSPSPNQQTKYN
jgi:hypothetical protein